MGRERKTKILKIYLNKFLIGHLKKSTSGAISFQYDQEWILTNFAISNSLPINEAEYKGEIVTRYFDNLLPDNEEIKQLVAKKFGAESIRSFDLLSAIGRDCVGALTFIPENESVPNFEEKIKFKDISVAAIAKKIRELGSKSPMGMDDGDLRLSIAGAQEKTALLKIDNIWKEPIGITPTTHIIKKSIGALGLDIDFKDSIDNEYACLYLMKKMGLETCEAQIELFEDQRVLVVERFDRIKYKNEQEKLKIDRIPQEDMCQVLGISPYKKYQKDGGPGIKDISTFLRTSTKKIDRMTFFKAIMIFDLLHAIDGHAKNFSVFMKRDGINLTPFYDVMSGYFLVENKKMHSNDLKLAMKIGNSGHYNFKKILKRHYEESALICNYSKDEFEEMRDDVKSAFDNLTIVDKELNSHLNHKTLEIILKGMKERALKIF